MGALTAAWQNSSSKFCAGTFGSKAAGYGKHQRNFGRCALKCAHCGGHYLSKMTPLSGLEKTEDIKGASCLISGGCDLSGKVAVMDKLTKLAQLKGEHRYNFHVGLLSEEEIKAVAPLADVVSFDFLGDDLTIKETLKLNKTVEDYLACYRLLKYCTHVAPHISVLA